MIKYFLTLLVFISIGGLTIVSANDTWTVFTWNTIQSSTWVFAFSWNIWDDTIELNIKKLVIHSDWLLKTTRRIILIVEQSWKEYPVEILQVNVLHLEDIMKELKQYTEKQNITRTELNTIRRRILEVVLSLRNEIRDVQDIVFKQ